MKDILFLDMTYILAEVNKVPDEVKSQINTLTPKEGECLKNSYDVAKKSNKIKMVEGFLITHFENGSVGAWAHVWNEIDGNHFDVTIGVKKHNLVIKKNEYYIASIYDVKEAKFEKKLKESAGMYDLWGSENHIVFKTNVKDIEMDFRDYIKNIEV